MIYLFIIHHVLKSQEEFSTIVEKYISISSPLYYGHTLKLKNHR